MLVATAFSYEAVALWPLVEACFSWFEKRIVLALISTTAIQSCLAMTSLTNDIHFNMSAVFQPSDLKRLLEGKDDL